MGIGNHITGFIKGSATELGAVMHNQNFTRLAANGIKNGNGNGTWKAIGAEWFGFGVAEAVSMMAGLGVYASLGSVAPSIVNGTAKVLAKTVIEPMLDPIESVVKVCPLDECQPDVNITREQRAQNMARTLVMFGASWAAAYSSKLITRRGMNHMFGLPVEEGSLFNVFKQSRKECIVLLSDEAIHHAALGALLFSPRLTDTTIRSMQNIFEEMGMSKKKAHEVSAYTMIWEMPNFLGLLAGLSAIYATHKFPRHLGLPSH